jgi:hypothetical protein
MPNARRCVIGSRRETGKENVMATLNLICECGKRRQFTGTDSKAIMAAIDASGWADMPTDKSLPRGSMAAICPACAEKADAERFQTCED